MSDPEQAGGNRSDRARFECSCGASEEFRKESFAKLHWLEGRFGYRNIASAIDDIRDCCDRPEYMEVRGWEELREEDDGLRTDGGQPGGGIERREQVANPDAYVPWDWAATMADSRGLHVLWLSARCRCGYNDSGVAPGWKVPAEWGGGYMTEQCAKCLATIEYSEEWRRVDRLVSDYSKLRPDDTEHEIRADGSGEQAVPESELIEDYDRPDEPDALHPSCPICGAVRGIHKAVVGPADDRGEHDVREYHLECGHEIDDPDARMDSGVVDLVRLQNPEYIEVVRDV